MRQFHDKRGKSDLVCSSCNRCQPGNSFTAISPMSFSGTFSHNETHECPSHYDYNPSLINMPQHSYHGQDVPDQPFETARMSQNLECEFQTAEYVCCPPPPCHNSPFSPDFIRPSTNGIFQPANNMTSTYPRRPSVPSTFAIRTGNRHTKPSTPYSFAYGSQNGAQLQDANMLSSGQNDVAGRIPVTPQLSCVTTPESISSTPITVNGVSNLSEQYGTLASSVTCVDRGYRNMQVMTPSHADQTLPGNGQEVKRVPYDSCWLSEHNSNNQDWLADYDVSSVLSPQRPASTRGMSQVLTTPNTEAEFMSSLSPNKKGLTHNEINGCEAIPDLGGVDPILGETFLTFPPPLSPLDIDTSGLDIFLSDNGATHEYSSQCFSSNGYTEHIFDFNRALHDENHPDSLGKVPVSSHSSAFAPATSNAPDCNHVRELSRSRQNNRNDEMDKKLVEWRNAGMSYKEIMAKGNFGLEESTLRGRYRTLTKSKDKRLRKPCWPEYAVKSLMEGVELLAPTATRHLRTKEALDKIPWKRVAEWMQSERGCYLYGNATVKKKYQELLRRQQQQQQQQKIESER